MSDVLLFDLSKQLETLFAQKQYAAGFALGRHILQSYPRHLATYKQMGLAALNAGLTADSVDLLQRALSADPEDGEMWAALHDATLQLNMHPDAEVAGAYAHDLLQPDKGTSPIARGHAAARKKNWEQAYQAYRQGFMDTPERMDAGLGLMTALFYLDQFEAALKVARHILSELPYSLKALWFAIRCSYELDDDTLPLKRWLRTARSLDPDDIYIVRWADDVPEEEHPHPRATLPAWDTSELWDHLANAPADEPAAKTEISEAH
jgi:tetratricopeptide (TPR) repeat protein